MTPNIIHLTEAGRQSLLNADAGGIRVAPKAFKLGDLEVSDVEDFYEQEGGIPDNLVSNTVYTGNISYVQVLSENTVRFTLDIPQGIPDANATSSITIGELVVLLEDNTVLGHCVYSEPYVKSSAEAIRIEAMLHISEVDAGTIDVTLSEFGSIPSVPTVEDLPSPVNAIANAVGVQTLEWSLDGNAVPGIAQKFGPGGAHWGFSGYTRIFNGEVGYENVYDETEFKQPDASELGNVQAGDVVVVQVIQGPGAGETRIFDATQNGDNIAYIAKGTGFSALSDTSVISIWYPRSGNYGATSLSWLNEEVPSNYVLERGVTSPRWVPPLKASGNGSTLYHPPGTLKMSAYVTEPEDAAGSRTFVLYQKDLSQVQSQKAQIHYYSHAKNNNYAMVALGGVTQHREAFEITENAIEFSEDLPSETQIDARLFTLTPSTGALLNIRYAEYIADGNQTEFDIPVVGEEKITSSSQCLVYVDPFLQSINNYVIDEDNQKIVFTTAPAQGLLVEINAFITQEVRGYATHVHTQNYVTKDLTRVLQLPFSPQDKGLVFVSEQGLHANRSLYDIVDDRLIFRRDIDANQEIEVQIFRNVLSQGNPDSSIQGVVTDALVTSKSIELVRHNLEPLRIPVPRFNMIGGTGIKVSGTFPEYTIESKLSQQIAKDKPVVFNNQHRISNAEEIIYTQRVNFKGDVIVKATADFNARLGPGFTSANGLENIEFVLGFRTHSLNEPEYGRNIKGTGSSGFNVTNPEQQGTYAYADKSITQSWNVLKANNPTGAIEIVAKMRVRNGRVSDYGSALTINLVVDVSPNLG